MTAVLFLHGWQNERPPEHWLTIVAGELGDRGVPVRYPQLPDPFTPSLEEWVATARRDLAALEGDDRAVVCHSLGCLAWGHLAARLEPGERPDRVCWVAPAGPAFTRGEPAIADFALDEAERGALAASSANVPFRLVWSAPDPYCEEGAGAAYADPLGLDSEFVAGGEHLNPDSGYGEWPAMTDWCLDPAARLG